MHVLDPGSTSGLGSDTHVIRKSLLDPGFTSGLESDTHVILSARFGPWIYLGIRVGYPCSNSECTFWILDLPRDWGRIPM